MLSIIIPVYNQREYTKALLAQIPLVTVGEYEIIVIDWASSDDTQEAIKSYDNVRYIRTPTNLFVNGAWNLWVEEAKWEYICIMNNDIVLTHGRDKPLVDNLVDNIMVTSPIYTTGATPFDGRWFRNNPSQPFNVCWHCFVMKKADRVPIIDKIRIWYGDNWVYDHMLRKKCIEMPVVDSKIHHYESKTVKSKNPMIEAIIYQDDVRWKANAYNYFKNIDK